LTDTKEKLGDASEKFRILSRVNTIKKGKSCGVSKKIKIGNIFEIIILCRRGENAIQLE
jgi:hypothetical protein